MTPRPTPGSIETRTAPDLLTTEDRRICGLIPYSVESRDMNGWTEVIEPGALDDLVVNVDHTGVPLGRHPGTLELEDRADGLHWSVLPPETRRSTSPPRGPGCDRASCSRCAGGTWTSPVSACTFAEPGARPRRSRRRPSPGRCGPFR